MNHQLRAIELTWSSHDEFTCASGAKLAKQDIEMI